MNLTATLGDLRRDINSAKSEVHFPSAEIEGVFSNGQPARIAAHPDGTPSLLLPIAVTEITKKMPECDGLSIKFQKYSVEKGSTQDFVELKCQSGKLESVFIDMMENICDRIKSGSAAVKSLNDSVADFRNLLINSSHNIDRKKALGLFGELLAAYRFSSKIIAIVDYWTGPFGHRRDFCLPCAAVEIKTSEKTDSRAVDISSLGQLDCDDYEKLFLFYLKVEEDPSNGKCIGDLVDHLMGKVGDDGSLKEKLAQAGYDNHTRKAFDAFCWRVIESRIYRVEDGFPRVIGSSFDGGKPAGVIDINYSIDLDQASLFETNLGNLLEEAIA